MHGHQQKFQHGAFPLLAMQNFEAHYLDADILFEWPATKEKGNCRRI